MCDFLVIELYGKYIIKDGLSFLERNSMLLEVRLSFVVILTELNHTYIACTQRYLNVISTGGASATSSPKGDCAWPYYELTR